MQPGAEQPRPVIKRRQRFLRPLLASLLLTILLTAFALAVLPSLGRNNRFDERELKLGSTTFHLECDDDEQSEFFQHESWDASAGELSSGRRITIGLPLLTLKFGYTYEPLEAIRARLPTNDITKLALLLDSGNPFEVTVVAHALAENPHAAVPALPSLLAATEKAVYLVGAIDAIVQAAPIETLPTLISALSSTNAELRNYCTRILSRLGTNSLPSAPALLVAFQKNRIDPASAAHALRKITGDCSVTIPKLRDELKNGPPDQRIFILRVLTEAGPQGSPALPEVLALLNSPADNNVKAHALEALSHICADAGVILPHIQSALAPPDPPSARTRVQPYPDSLPSNRVRAAIESLVRLGPAGVPDLVPLYQGTNLPVKTAAAGALAKIGPPAAIAVEPISAELRSSKPHDVALACEIVSHLGTNATAFLPTLTNLLFVPNPGIRAHAAVTFARLGHCNDTLLQILADSLAAGDVAARIYQTVQPIIQTNSAAKTVFHQRLAINRKAARSYRAQSILLANSPSIRLDHYCCLP